MTNVFHEIFSSRRYKKIVVLVGAGISTSAGIPDFKNGIYAELSKQLVSPEQSFNPEYIFTPEYFSRNHRPYWDIVRPLIEQDFQPTAFHQLLAQFDSQRLLHRVYTQNIDSLEYRAGVCGKKIVYAHGNLLSAYCTTCYCRQQSLIDDTCSCGGHVRHSIVMYGELLPRRFHHLWKDDMRQCDLCIIAGTSMRVFPFCILPEHVKPRVPLIVINNENNRYSERAHVFYRGSCDDAAQIIGQYFP